MILKTWMRMMAAFSCLFDERVRQVVEYLKEENRVLREQLHAKSGCRQVRLTDSQRRRLATKGVAVGRRLLDDVTDLFSPDTILKWYRQLIAKKYGGSPNRKGGRPEVSQEIIDTVLRLATETPFRLPLSLLY